MFSSSSYIADSAMNRKEWVNPRNTEKNSTKIYTYDNNGNLIKSENYLNICEFSYDENGRMTRQTFYNENERSGYIDYTYDNNNNLTTRLHYWILSSGKTELQTTTEYEYDNKINPYKAFSSLKIPGQYTNANNIVKETYTINHDVDQSKDKVQITENTYKYNSRGLPVSKNKSETFIYY
jgi:YD repeat-containing protein